MSIVSVSINDKLMRDMDSLSKELGYSGRSEVFRAALRDFMNAHYTKTLSADTTYNASVSVVIAEEQKNSFDHLYHHMDLVRSQFHLCLTQERCMLVLGIVGKGKHLLDLLKKIESFPKVEKIDVCVDE